MSETELEQAAPETEAPEPEAPPEEEAWSVSRDEWDQSQAALGFLAERFAPPVQQEAPEGPSLPDWIDEDDQARIDAYIESKLSLIHI